jgi:hypothetical protein
MLESFSSCGRLNDGNAGSAQGDLVMKKIMPTLLAAASIGAVSIGSAVAMPFNNVAAGLGNSQAQDVRVVCNRYGRCYNTARVYRHARPYYARRYYGAPAYYAAPRYYAAPDYGYYDGPVGYGYRSGPSVGIGIGPFGLGLW